MLKRNRKLNKATLIATSRAYGKCRKDVTKYRVFQQLKSVHGEDIAAEMVADALHNCPSVVDSVTASVWDFVVWGDTDHFEKWDEAGNRYP
uniref:Uncharacterized protein n=1 Tax=Aeromonas phage vB_AdhaP_MF TaxID=3367373 RepID=A0AB74UJA1_9CAUD